MKENYAIVDRSRVPEGVRTPRIPWEELFKGMREDKAIRVTFPTRIEAQSKRACAYAASPNGVSVQTSIIGENGNFVLYVWRK